MIEFIFSLDYEIYGNGTGTLDELVYEPTQKLISIFRERNAAFVAFAEAVEFQKIEEFRADEEGIRRVREQLRELHETGFEIGLHLHPWWHNARFINDEWQLDYGLRNICRLPEPQIEEIVSSAVGYLREAIGVQTFKPLSFRGGLWLMQPTCPMAAVLARAGVQIDSSLFKGGRIRDLGIDYRPAHNNGGYWRFSGDVNLPDEDGLLLEIPIHTEMVPFWKMLGQKRLKLQKKVPASRNGNPLSARYLDFARLTYPRKLDFCRMDLDELCKVIDAVRREDERAPGEHRVIVAIGHSKDLVAFDTVIQFLAYLERWGIAVTTFNGVAARLRERESACRMEADENFPGIQA